MCRLAREPNIVCKISALVSVDRRRTTPSLARWVLGCLEAFGPQRCMLASDWPVDKLFTSYAKLLTEYRAIAGQLSPAEQRAVFAETAERVYRV
jgi:predicted TIM-barrel fold metal-dependent hydrolase